ncbi:hypothetical protein FOZ60_013831 [Perkinsus olseni]|uniref:RRM domain-containing protein n=2 Tax=Perkinsus olseni TaxID=32597 RepID=A0A7J6PAC8_PEROL|nr:hypothetical protein FOZ60_013831 [Perkinsus olseni]
MASSGSKQSDAPPSQAPQAGGVPASISTSSTMQKDQDHQQQQQQQMGSGVGPVDLSPHSTTVPNSTPGNATINTTATPTMAAASLPSNGSMNYHVASSPASSASHASSKVLYVRNIPMSLSEQNLIAYCQSFGRVTNILILRDKRHGFIEFENETEARRCHAYYSANPLTIDGQRLDFAISRFSEITGRRYPDLHPPNRILLFTITNVVYPVNVSMIAQVMSRYNALEKVVIFTRGNATHCLIQMSTLEAAVAAKTQLDGQNIFTHCNTIRVQFSELSKLEVKYNNERSWDYTNPSLPSGPPGAMAGSGLLGPQQRGMSGVAATPVVFVLGLNEKDTTPDDLAALFAVYGNVVKVKIMYKARNSALVQMQTVGECHTAIAHLKGIRLHGNKLTMEMSKGGRELPPIPPPGAEQTEADRLSRDYTSQSYLYARHRADQTSRPFPPSSSLYFSNMPHGTTEEDLRELLDASGCQYTGIRFLNEQHHMAIVQCVSLDNAIETLCRAHAKPVGHPPRPVRVGFGNTVPKRPVTPPFTPAPVAVMPTFANGAPVDPLAYQSRTPPVQAATPVGDMSVAGSSQKSFEMMNGVRTMPNPYQAMMMSNARTPPPGVQRQVSAGPQGGQLYSSSPNPVGSANNAQQPF